MVFLCVFASVVLLYVSASPPPPRRQELCSPSSSCSLRHPACHSLTVVFAYVPNIPELLTFRSSISLFASLYVHTFPHPCTHALHLPARAPSTPLLSYKFLNHPHPASLCYVFSLAPWKNKQCSSAKQLDFCPRTDELRHFNMKQGQ